MMPVIAYNVLLTGQILTQAMHVLATRTVTGLEANREQAAYWVERSAALATALAPQIGYARAAELSKQSVKDNVLIRDLVRREHVLPAEDIDEVLDLRKMTEIGVPGAGAKAAGARAAGAKAAGAKAAGAKAAGAKAAGAKAPEKVEGRRSKVDKKKHPRQPARR
jgi:hypothetical protein